MQKRAVAEYPKICAEIDQLVAEIASLVSELPAERLLHRAWGEMAVRHMNITSEAEVDTDDAISMRMIDYIQSVIAATAPSPAQRKDVTEEEWQTLRGKVDALFSSLNLGYQVCRTAKAKAEEPGYDDDFEEFRYKAQMYWCNVRGDRFQVHEKAYLQDMFLPHSAVVQELFGITSEQFFEEFDKITQALTFGLGDVVQGLDEFRKESLAALEAKMLEKPPSAVEQMPQLMAEVIEENGWEQRRDALFGGFFGTDLFDIQKVTTLSQTFLDELTWSPGEDTEFFAEGDFRGWPLRIWPVFKRPFMRIGDRYYCFDLHNLCDHIYRVMQRIILRLKPDYAETWKLTQQRISEDLPLEYLQKMLPGAKEFRSVYYSWYPDAAQKKKGWCEADGLLIYDDHLFIVESLGGAFTYTSPAEDFPAYIASLRNLVLKPAMQGIRFLDYLSSADVVDLFDKDHKKVGELRKSDFRHTTISPITLDPFTDLAAQVQHLRKIGVDVGAHPVWAISLDDLRVYADIFEDPLLFLHFVEMRMRAFGSDLIELDDELDHLGLYLKHNHYVGHAEDMRGKSGARLTFTGYRAAVDEFFAARLADHATPCPLKQEMPARLLQIVEFLSRGTKSGRAAISSYLLDHSGELREGLAGRIEQEIARQPKTKRHQPLSTHGETRLTLWCWTPSSISLKREMVPLDHALTTMLATGEDDRVSMELTVDGDGNLQDVAWQFIKLANFDADKLERLKPAANRLREARLAKSKAEKGKIGRNAQCPCGSGNKYKKCCLMR